MAVELANHIHEMTNAELNSTAKLRFTDKETQIALAAHKYLLCRKYLAHNPNLCRRSPRYFARRKGEQCQSQLDG